MSSITLHTVNIRLVDATRDVAYICPHCMRGGFEDNAEGVYAHVWIEYKNRYGNYTRIVLDGCFNDPDKFGQRHVGQWFKPQFNLIDSVSNRIPHPNEERNNELP